MRHAETQEKIALPAKEGRTEAMNNMTSILTRHRLHTAQTHTCMIIQK